jgi:hypothetical protein
MYYSKEDIQELKILHKGNKEIIINNFVNKFTNIVIDYIEGGYNTTITLTMHSTDTKNYTYRVEIVERLKRIFPSMKISTKYTIEDMEYLDITFDWA